MTEESERRVDDRSECSADVDLRPLLQALRASIPADKAKLQPFQVLAYLADETERRLDYGRAIEISTKDIYVDLNGNPNREPSAWLARLWRDIETKFYPQIEESVVRHCYETGCTHFPRPRKAEGSPAQYFIEAVPIGANALPERERPMFSSTDGLSIVYEPDLTLKLSWIGNLAIRGGLAWTKRKKIAAAAWFLLSLLALVVFTGLAWLVLVHSKTPLTAQDLTVMLLMIGMPWIVIRQLDRSTRVFEDRIVIAPEWLLAWKEFGATLEIEGEPSSNDIRVFKVARYTAKCPICAGMVRIEAGEPDYPRRLVGRCSKSPREHVFSFDRVTRRGRPLIVPA